MEVFYYGILQITRTSRGGRENAGGKVSCAAERAMRKHCRGQSSPGHHNKNRPQRVFFYYGE